MHRQGEHAPACLLQRGQIGRPRIVAPARFTIEAL